MNASASMPASAAIGNGVSDRLSKKASRHVKERVIESLLFAAAAFSVFVTIAIVYILVKESWVFFQQPCRCTGFCSTLNGHRYSMMRITASWCCSRVR
jgi:ABC-type phosphate transport system permease subunit